MRNGKNMDDSLQQQYRIYISSSIANFKEKLLKRIGFEEYQGWRDINKPTIFFGLYHWRDYWRFLRHRGKKKVFWCGSDILAFEKWQQKYAWSKKVYLPLKWWLWIIGFSKHYCENKVEQQKLLELSISSEIRPMIFDDPSKFKVSYKYSDNPKLFATYHKGREKEYGFRRDIHFLEGLSENDFNWVIPTYQGAYRPNRFDGFAETLAKSLLMGQYPISWIRYPKIACLQDISLEEHLEILRTKKQFSNLEGREYWLKVFEESKNEICDNWSW